MAQICVHSSEQKCRESPVFAADAEIAMGIARVMWEQGASCLESSTPPIKRARPEPALNHGIAAVSACAKLWLASGEPPLHQSRSGFLLLTNDLALTQSLETDDAHD
jgi:hypothetical protein